MKNKIVAMICLILGFWLGYFSYKWLVEPKRWLAHMGNIGLMHEYAEIQYRQASYEEASAVLDRYLRALENAKPTNDELWGKQSLLAYDKTIVAGKLALLHEKAGKKIEADQCWLKAENYARQAKWMNPSRENIRRVIEQIPERWKTPLNNKKSAG